MNNYQFLDKVNFPSDIKKLSVKELKILSKEVRNELEDLNKAKPLWMKKAQFK